MWPWHLKIMSIHFLIQSINKAYCYYTAEIETSGRKTIIQRITNNTLCFRIFRTIIITIALPRDQLPAK